MFFENFRDKFTGRDFWTNLNKIIGWGAYTIFMMSALAAPQYIGWIVLVFVVILPAYGYYYRGYMLEQEKNRKGNKVVEGWVTHAYGKGERIYLTPANIELEDKLSDEALGKIKDYVALLDQQAKATEIETGISKFRPKLLTAKEITEKELEIKAEMRERKEQEKEALKKTEEEYREKKILTHQNNNAITDEEELEDE